MGRYTALLKKDAATQVDVDHWNFEKASAEANILAAQAQVGDRPAEPRLYRSARAVRRPDGQAPVDPGNVVGGNGQEAALAEITQLDPIYVVANISSQQALADPRKPRPAAADAGGTAAAFRSRSALAGESGVPHHGTIQYVAPQIDPATGTLYVRGILHNPDRTLLPGMFVNMRLPMGKIVKSALLVPDRALQDDQGGRYLLVRQPGRRDAAALCAARRA